MVHCISLSSKTSRTYKLLVCLLTRRITPYLKLLVLYYNASWVIRLVVLCVFSFSLSWFICLVVERGWSFGEMIWVSSSNFKNVDYFSDIWEIIWVECEFGEKWCRGHQFGGIIPCCLCFLGFAVSRIFPLPIFECLWVIIPSPECFGVRRLKELLKVGCVGRVLFFALGPERMKQIPTSIIYCCLPLWIIGQGLGGVSWLIFLGLVLYFQDKLGSCTALYKEGSCIVLYIQFFEIMRLI